MSDLTGILRSSFKMLLDRPQLFVPRLVSASFSSALFAYILLDGIVLADAYVMLAGLPALIVLGVFTPVMTAAMVRIKDGKKLLMRGFSEALENWKGMLALIALSTGILLLTGIIYTVGLGAAIITESIALLIVVLMLNVLIALVAGFYLYFTPIAILDDRGARESLRKAFNSSNRNRKEVSLLMLFSFTLLLLSSTVSGTLRTLGITAFVLGRLSSSVTGTYLLVISPNYYLQEAK